MKTILNAFRKPGLRGFGFVLALLLLNWPLLSIAHDRGPLALYVYLFAVWLLIILLTLIFSAGAGKAPPPQRRPGDTDDV